MKTDREKFYDLLDRFPQFSRFWDREKHICDLDNINSLAGLSSGEVVIRNVLVSIWGGRALDQNRIDITDLASLSPDALRPIIEWLAAPYWP